MIHINLERFFQSAEGYCLGFLIFIDFPQENSEKPFSKKTFCEKSTGKSKKSQKSETITLCGLESPFRIGMDHFFRGTRSRVISKNVNLKTRYLKKIFLICSHHVFVYNSGSSSTKKTYHPDLERYSDCAKSYCLGFLTFP